MTVRIQKGKALEGLALTPLIDIVFLLLIFFLVATKFAEEERELDILLPDASEAKPLISKPRELFINIDAQGDYFVTGKAVDIESLAQILTNAWTHNPGHRSVIIRADKRCHWQAVVAAMNACNRAKIRDYRVTTRE